MMACGSCAGIDLHLVVSIKHTVTRPQQLITCPAAGSIISTFLQWLQLWLSRNPTACYSMPCVRRSPARVVRANVGHVQLLTNPLFAPVMYCRLVTSMRGNFRLVMHMVLVSSQV